MSSPQRDQQSTLPPTRRDRACAVLARAALFPISVDWSGKHHAIRPALHALDLVRSDIVEAEKTPYSKLFPRDVIVVPSQSGGMQWNGQPEIRDSTVEVIPEKLTVRCMECRNENPGIKAYIQRKENHPKAVYDEIVLCTNRLLQSDYNKVEDPSLLEQRRDLPPSSLRAVEEVLAHQITKLRGKAAVEKEKGISPCEKLAKLEIQAARMAECFYQKEAGEVHRGSALRPPGFSLLPRSMQDNFRNRCARAIAIEATSLEFKREGKKCVDAVLRSPVET